MVDALALTLSVFQNDRLALYRAGACRLLLVRLSNFIYFPQGAPAALAYPALLDEISVVTWVDLDSLSLYHAPS